MGVAKKRREAEERRRAEIADLKPHAWNPVRVELDGRKYIVHVDQSVYESRGGSARRVRDPKIVEALVKACREKVGGFP